MSLHEAKAFQVNPDEFQFLRVLNLEFTSFALLAILIGRQFDRKRVQQKNMVPSGCGMVQLPARA